MIKHKFSLKNDPFRKREQLKYSDPIPSREYILDGLHKISKPINSDELAAVFGLRTTRKKEAFRRRLLAMMKDGQVFANRRGGFILVDKKYLVRGVIVGHKDGFGFLVPEDGGKDIFLPPRQMRSVFPNDRVLVQVLNPQNQGRLEGAIVEVLERNLTHIVGRYFVEDGLRFVVPVNKDINQNIIIPEAEFSHAKSGQFVVAEITSYPTNKRQGIAKITEVLGNHLAPGMEIEVAIRSHNLPNTWSDEVQNEIKKISEFIPSRCHHDRQDLRSLPFVTIDGEDAKDFDDAIFCEPNNNGWRLYVAIADVSHYVKPGTMLDGEALKRGNSVYFPSKVVPMLPEILSNGLCSLKPNEDRLCMVCDMKVNHDGKVINYKFYEAMISSHARLTYTQVADMLSNKKNNHTIVHLQNLYKLSQVLHKQRRLLGALEFETLETKIIFGKNHKINQIVPIIRNVAHQVVEECMLGANVCAAHFLLHKKIPSLYRVHESPDAEKIENFKTFLHGLGLKIGGGDSPKSADYARLLETIKGRSDEHLIQKILLRSMRQAVYDEENIGHFSLAFEAYGHFTSPIRRYPDLITHRAIKHAISGGKASDFYYDSSAVHNFGEHCSMTERRADAATRDVTDWLKCEYMRDKLGKKFPGIISSVTNFGLFVELKDIYVEGLIHITSLPHDFYQFNQSRYSLIGKRSGKIYRLGDSILVQVARVDLDDRNIDFVPVETTEKRAKSHPAKNKKTTRKQRHR